MKAGLSFCRHDVAAWCVFAVYAASSLSVPVVLVQMAESLDFPLSEGGMGIGGSLQAVRSVAMCLAMAGMCFVAAVLGNRRPLGVACLMMGAGILMVAFAPSWRLALPMLLVAGLGEGVIEGLATPFVQNLHEKEPGRYINFAHGFWSLGTFGFVILAGLALVSGVSWRVIVGAVGLAAVPCALLLLLPIGMSYPEKRGGRSFGETVAAVREIVSIRRFWLFFAAMIFAGGGEYCLTFWAASFIQLNFAASALAGALGTAAFAAGMFTGRTGFAAVVPQSRLKELIVAVGIFGAAVAAMLPLMASHLAAVPQALRLPALFVLLYLAGIGSAPFWPSIQSLTVDRLPHIDSTLAFIILSCAGVPGCGAFSWLMGVVGDKFGLQFSYCLVPMCYVAMVALVLAGDRNKAKG